MQFKMDAPQMSRRLIIVLLFAAVIPLSAAQRAGFPNGGFRSGFRGGFIGNGNGRFARGAGFWGAPFFYADYPNESLPYQAPASPVVIVEQAASPAPSQPEPIPEPVMIEWQGDRYVRSVGDRPANGAEDYAEASPSAAPTARVKQFVSADLPPVILVYRDRHREQVSNYVIEDGNLYARGNYWQDGYWNKTVQLVALDIPATLKANSESGVKFVLPSGPNEIVTRP